MKKNTKVQEEKPVKVKEPKTIQVKTLVMVLLWISTVIAGLIVGWNLRSMDNARIERHAEQIIQSSKLSQ